MIDINDLAVGDVIVSKHTRCVVTSIDILTEIVKTSWQGREYEAHISNWSINYSKEQPLTVAQAQQGQVQHGNLQIGGIGAWLPQQIQYHPQLQPPQIIQAVIKLEPEPPKKTRKQVSYNGKDWCDYRLLLDADPFESYEHRREI